MPAPQWVIDWRDATQRNADARYADALLRYEQARTDWVSGNLQNRALGLPLTPIPTPPKHIIFTIDGITLKQEEVLDPNLKPPVLPPPTPVQPSVPFKTDAPATTDQILAMLAGCLQMLGEMKADVEAIKAKLA